MRPFFLADAIMDKKCEQKRDRQRERDYYRASMPRRGFSPYAKHAQNFFVCVFTARTRSKGGVCVTVWTDGLTSLSYQTSAAPTRRFRTERRKGVRKLSRNGVV